ncbi:MAG: nucleoside 2-deoxyribosyltransferase [Deltaproteobacteria bacterium]|nr:nucleoside 2-deoxyribosyltransferase [Deltaproteobacteria bacterium]
MPKVYFAGPDVFKKDYGTTKSNIRKLCEPHGIIPLIPGDDTAPLQDGDPPSAIYRQNIDHIRDADGVIANLEPFRGVVEPDSGTAFEVGHAAALGKWIIGYLPDRRPITKKLLGSPYGDGGDEHVGINSEAEEEFGYPVNLMLYKACDKIVGSLEEAVLLAAKRP